MSQVTLHTLIQGVRAELGYPLVNNPSEAKIIVELASVLQEITNLTNNMGQSWQTVEYTLTTVAGQRKYEITPPAIGDFFKALIVTTVPENENADPEYRLEFVEKEHIPDEWAWLNQGRGQYMYSSHDSQIIAFYNQMEVGGAKKYCELRPTPTRAQDYLILFQHTDWFDDAIDDKQAVMPHSSQRHYIQCLAAKSLLQKYLVKWSFNEEDNDRRSRGSINSIDDKLVRLQPAFEQYIASLDTPDVVYQESWLDDQEFVL